MIFALGAAITWVWAWLGGWSRGCYYYYTAFGWGHGPLGCYDYASANPTTRWRSRKYHHSILKIYEQILKITIMIPESLWFHDSGIDSDSSQQFFDSVNYSWFWLWFVILRLILDFKLIPETVVRDSTCVNWTPRVCAIFVKVWFYSAKNCISASDSSQTENPIKAWAFHTITLLRRGSLCTPDSIQLICSVRFSQSFHSVERTLCNFPPLPLNSGNRRKNHRT